MHQNPFLYSHSIKRQNGGSLIFGELPHDILGLIEDYKAMLKVNNLEELLNIIELLTYKKKIYNKMPCPIKGDITVGKTRQNYKKHLNILRRAASRKYYKELLKDLKRG